MELKDYYPETIAEVLAEDTYARVIKLQKEEEAPIYMLEVLFKYTHEYKNSIFSSEEKTIELYNKITDWKKVIFASGKGMPGESIQGTYQGLKN